MICDDAFMTLVTSVELMVVYCDVTLASSTVLSANFR